MTIDLMQTNNKYDLVVALCLSKYNYHEPLDFLGMQRIGVLGLLLSTHARKKVSGQRVINETTALKNFAIQLRNKETAAIKIKDVLDTLKVVTWDEEV